MSTTTDTTSTEKTTPMSAFTMKSSKETPSQSSNGRGPGLPTILHRLLDESPSEIISWVGKGKAFKIHDRNAFIEHIMPKYFDTNTWKSYQRNINLWCFVTIRKGAQKGWTSHPLFIRGEVELCQGMSRIRIKGTGKKRGGIRLPSLSNDLALTGDVPKTQSTSPRIVSTSNSPSVRKETSPSTSSVSLPAMNRSFQRSAGVEQYQPSTIATLSALLQVKESERKYRDTSALLHSIASGYQVPMWDLQGLAFAGLNTNSGPIFPPTSLSIPDISSVPVGNAGISSGMSSIGKISRSLSSDPTQSLLLEALLRSGYNV